MNKCLYLDDIRIPQRIPHGFDEWIIVRNYDQFVDYINNNGIPDLISFDHDLADEHYNPSMYLGIEKYNEISRNFTEKTGFDCAKWLVEYCMDNNIKMCQFTVHSANPAGAENILGLLNNFRKNCGQEQNGFRTFW